MTAPELFFNLFNGTFLIILFMYFKIALWMVAYRAYLRSLGSYYNVSAVTAFPYLNLTLLKYLGSLNIFKKCTVSFFMVLLNLPYSAE